MKKRKHHHVWRHYLRSWSKNDQIWARINSKILHLNLENVAQERDFYQIKEINAEEINLITQILKNIREDLKPLNKAWVDLFNYLVSFRNNATQNGVHQKLQAEFDDVIFNFEEELQSEIENSSIPYLEKISRGDISFYNITNDIIKFNYFISSQYFRTIKLKNVLSTIESKNPNFNLTRIRNILAHIFATNMGYIMSEDKNLHCVLLYNTTGLPLITGDQPVINTFSSYKENEILSCDQFELYYPQSPILGLLITKRPEFRDVKDITMDNEMVKKYNDVINAASEAQLYANNEDSLKLYLN